jgi:hypothetical protein
LAEISDAMSMEDRTKQSGRLEVNMKYRYPWVLALLLNEFALSPFHIMQRLFYSTHRGTMLLARGTKP